MYYEYQPLDSATSKWSLLCSKIATVSALEFAESRPFYKSYYRIVENQQDWFLASSLDLATSIVDTVAGG